MLPIGHRFHKITVISEPYRESTTRQSRVMVRCDCGSEYSMFEFSAKRGNTRQCNGCAKKSPNRMASGKRTGRANKTHGLTGTAEYRAWNQMKNRCLIPTVKAYPSYGGRGIKVSPLWLNDFPAFLSHVGPRPSPQHSLDRLDNNGNYEPGNVAWRTFSEQNANRRNSVNIEFRGESVPLAELARRFDMPYCKLHRRIVRLGWNVEDAVSIKDGRSFKPA